MAGRPGRAAAPRRARTAHAAVLLTLPASARGLALGEAWGAVADDESALFYNPAQLARVHGLAVGGSLQNYIASTTLGAFAVAVPLRRGTVAFGLQLLDYGSAEEVVPADGSNGQVGTPTGSTVTAEDMAFTLGYGIAFGSRHELRLGAAVEYARQEVASYSGGAMAGDVGAAYTSGNGWDLSAAVQHLGSKLTLAAVTAPLPLTWRAAVAAPALRASRSPSVPMAEVRQVSGAELTGVLGTEVTWHTGTAAPCFPCGRVTRSGGPPTRARPSRRGPASPSGGFRWIMRTRDSIWSEAPRIASACGSPRCRAARDAASARARPMGRHPDRAAGGARGHRGR